jgi:sigma-B regulation protein RsbU (phosphoserine phosphatase)
MQDVQQQLEAVRALQRRLLPRHLPQLEGWRLAVHYAVGPWPGGDYYDFLPLADGRLLLFLADASDEGAPSAALVAVVRVLLHSCPLSSGQDRLPFCPLRGELVQAPHVILANLDRVIVENALPGQSMTAFCGLLSPTEGTLHYANAGHPPPLLWRARARTVEAVRGAMGLPLGMVPSAAYHHKRLEIEPGDVLLWCTDGLTAAQNRSGVQFGSTRLEEALGNHAPGGAEVVRDGVVQELTEFVAEKGTQDDVTVVVLERCQ